MKDLRAKLEQVVAEHEREYDRLTEQRIADNEATDNRQSELEFFHDLIDHLDGMQAQIGELQESIKDPAKLKLSTARAIAAEKFPLSLEIVAKIREQHLRTMISSRGIAPVEEQARTLSDAEFAQSLSQYETLFPDESVRQQMLRALLEQHRNGEIRFTDGQLKRIQAAI